MKVGIFETPPQKWFPYGADVEVLLQFLEKETVNDILMKGAEAAKKMKAKPTHVQDIFLGKSAVLGWRNPSDHDQPGLSLPDGKPLPFTPENRNLLIAKSQRFSEFVYRTCTDETKFLDDDLPQLDAGDLRGLDDLLSEMAKEEKPGNE
jgi:hypothetical protein